MGEQKKVRIAFSGKIEHTQRLKAEDVEIIMPPAVASGGSKVRLQPGTKKRKQTPHFKPNDMRQNTTAETAAAPPPFITLEECKTLIAAAAILNRCTDPGNEHPEKAYQDAIGNANNELSFLLHIISGRPKLLIS